MRICISQRRIQIQSWLLLAFHSLSALTECNMRCSMLLSRHHLPSPRASSQPQSLNKYSALGKIKHMRVSHLPTCCFLLSILLPAWQQLDSG